MTEQATVWIAQQFVDGHVVERIVHTSRDSAMEDIAVCTDTPDAEDPDEWTQDAEDEYTYDDGGPILSVDEYPLHGGEDGYVTIVPTDDE